MAGLPNFSENRQLKYLTSELAKCMSSKEKVAVYIQYLSGCKFNCTYHPGEVIKFTGEDIEHLATWATNKINNEANVDNEVQNKKCFYVRVVLITQLGKI